MRKNWILLIAGLVLISGVVVAVEKDIMEVDQRAAPPNFDPLDGPYCSQPNVAIPDNDGGAAVDTIAVTDSGFITDLNVSLQIEHTWVGDLRAELTNGACTIQLLHRVNLDCEEPDDGSCCCGCSGDDIDAVFDDDAADYVEFIPCSGTPAISGSWKPGDPQDNGIWPTAMADCNGQDINGDWTLTVTDGAAGDTGMVLAWCLIPDTGGGDGGGDGGGVPATTGVGLVLLVLALGGGGAYFLRRK